ncbi:MAG: ABC transporter ATP-binding protein/permease [Oscillospiraceae bacterium]|jgi:ATP-binding cassette subfamily C protein|nr:ABC transporter ATP-binding protein/permease [Oscillospiraceae bacterium]
MAAKPKLKYSLAQNFVWMLKSIREFDRTLLTWIAMNGVSTALGNMVPIVFPKLIIDELTIGGRTERVIFLAILFGVMLFITNGITGISYGFGAIPSGSMSIRFIALRIKFHQRQNLKSMTMDFENLENPEILDKHAKAERAFYGNYSGLEGMSRQVLTMFRSLLTLIGTISVVIVTGYWLLLIAAVIVTITSIMSDRARIKTKQIQDELAPNNRKIEYLQNMTTDFTYGKDIRIFGFKNFILGKFKEAKETDFSGSKKIFKIELFNSNIGAVLTGIQEAAVYAWMCYKVIAGAINIGSFLMYVASMATFSAAMKEIVQGFVDLQQQSAVINDYREYDDLIDTPPTGAKPPESIRDKGAEIEFENVSFKYPGSEQYALKNVSFKINLREKLAIVGLNGAGKSTFVKLLMRLYKPESGRILMNGTDVQTYSRDEYYKLFGAVFQEIYTFAFSVAENISLEKYDKTNMQRVKETIELAGLQDKIATLKKGIDTPMMKNLDLEGVEFSGGEMQKLALARALYKDAPFIVLDEPTAALDALAEERLYLNFDELCKGKTAIYISHRLASTQFCDRIVLFDQGGIAECGTHTQLLAGGGKYAELFNIQAQYYRDNPESEAI